jgi:secreted trypsin-like serine protease
MLKNRARGVTVAAVAIAVVAALAPPADAIIGGHDATEDYPFIATLRDGNGMHYCGGTLVAPRWVVTAGHCSHVPVKDVTVKVGGTDVEKGGSVRGVTKVVRHPRYTADPDDLRYDIALFELDRPVGQTPIRIAARSGAPGTPVRLLGWGMTCEDGSECPDLPVTLQELDSRIVPDDRCEGIDAATDLCSEHPTRQAQACVLDSGGPLLREKRGRWELAGITSRDGDEETDPDCVGPGVWTDATAYADWIRKTTGPCSDALMVRRDA